MYSANVLGKDVCTAAGEPQFNAHMGWGCLLIHTQNHSYIDFREAYLCFHQFQNQ